MKSRNSALLEEWFRENQREMPWRKTKNPYFIWISEVMLQQTQVATVIPYYLRFIEAFPTPLDLANASLEEVHHYWQGLGYYRRGENLWKGAKVIVERWQGVFPKEIEEISEIPGIGPYTLGAVGSIAFGYPLPAVDGNVMRVMARWYAMPDDISAPKNKKLFEQKVMLHMTKDPGTFNQALMELGATICTPKNPNCEICPVREGCDAHEMGREEDYPVKLKKVKPVDENYYVLLIKDGEDILMIKRPKEGLLANLWGLPMVQEEQWQALGLTSTEFITYKEVTHVFSHRKWHMIPVAIKKEKIEKVLEQLDLKEPCQWINSEELHSVPIGTAFKKVLTAFGEKVTS